jgi:hypothetical protein
MATALNASGNNTEWILLGNPSSGFAPLQIGYLRGNRTPIIERGEAPFTTLGMHMRCYYDFGIAPHDSARPSITKASKQSSEMLTGPDWRGR